MLTMNLRSNMAELVKDLDLERREHRLAAQRALNVAARGRVTDASRALRDRYPSLKARDAKDAFDLRLASRDNLTAVVTVRGRPFSLIRFERGQVKKVGGGVRVNVKGGTKLIKHAFIARGKSFGGGEGAEVVFVRQQYAPRSKAGPSGIVALRTIDLPNAVSIKELREILEQQTGDRFDKEFIRQLDLALKGPR